MSRLKNITLGPISLQMFKQPLPTVNGVDQENILFLVPGEDVDESLWLVTDKTDVNYNAADIESYIKKNILTRIP